MAPRSDAPPSEGTKSLQDTATELFELARDYAKQETIDPLKGLWRFVGLGLAGAVLHGLGMSMLILAGLRFLQTETGSTFTGNWSWAPYLITAAVGLLAIALALLRISKRKGPGA